MRAVLVQVLLPTLGRTRTQICPGKVVLKRFMVLLYNVEGCARTDWLRTAVCIRRTSIAFLHRLLFLSKPVKEITTRLGFAKNRKGIV